MNITFKSVKMKNFLSFGNIETNFEYSPGIHAITGHVEPDGKRNGVGKSSLIADSITFALYNKTIRKVNKNEIINTANGKDCVVTVEFNVNRTDYKVERGISPTYLKVWEGDEEIQFDKMSNTQKWLEDKLGISFDAFTNMIVLNINHSKPFLEMSPQEKRPVLEDILSLSIYGRMSEFAKKYHLEAKSDLRDMETSLRKDNESLEVSKQRKENIQKEIDKFENEKKERISKIKKEIKKLSSEKSQLESKIPDKDWESKLEEGETKLKEVKKKIENLNNDLYKSNHNIQVNKEALELLENEPYCPTCHTPTDNPVVKEFIRTTKDTIKENEDKVNELTSKIKKGKEVKYKIESTIDSIKEKIKRKNDFMKRIDILDSKIGGLKDNLKVEEERELTLNNVITEEDIKNQEKSVKESEELFTETSDKFNYYSVIRNLLGEDGIRKYVIKKILPFLNKKANHYLGLLGSDYTLTFDTELNEKLIARNRDERAYASFSGGEKRRIDLALLLALMDVAKTQNSIDTNILILDEILDTSMDSDGVESFMEHLNTSFKVAYPDKCIYIVTHRKDLNSEFFDNIVNLVKRNGFTSIEEIVD